MRLGPLELLQKAAKELEPLLYRLVFVGGSVTGLLLTDRAAPAPRFTDDVDTIIELASAGDLLDQENAMRKLGFYNDPEIICRWHKESLVVDVMPVGEEILGFTNKWYKEAFENSVPRQLGDGQVIRIIAATYFLATKIEAYKGRGNGDFFGSRDIEDIVALVNGRAELLTEIEALPSRLKSFLASEISRFLELGAFSESIDGHLAQSDPSRVGIVLNVFRRIAAIESD